MGNKKLSSVVLASASPRRRELLALLELDFQVFPAEVDEQPLPGEPAPGYVLRLAEHKARWVAARQGESVLVLAADTTIVAGGQILGKPTDSSDAERMLRSLRGRVHQVYSGIAVARDRELVTDLCVTDVPMRQYSDQEMDAYIASGDPMDKAGAYAIQNAAFHPVLNINGCFANVMGLPLCHLTRTLRKMGLEVDHFGPESCQEHIHYTCPVYSLIL